MPCRLINFYNLIHACFLLLLEWPIIVLAFASAPVSPKKIRTGRGCVQKKWQPTHTSTAVFSTKNPLEEKVASWASDSGYGEIESFVNSGRSGWASFFKVQVSEPPRPEMTFFIKYAKSKPAHEMFKGEALGLKFMHECSKLGSTKSDDGTTYERATASSSTSLKIPEVFYWGDVESEDGSGISGSILIMEFLSLGPRRDEHAFGVAMANLHLANPVDKPEAGNPLGKFGFPMDNTIGGTPQPNPWTNSGDTKDWIEFFDKHRIFHQLELAEDEYLIQLWKEDIAPRLERLFAGIEVKPSLLHGDLWSGNIGSAKIIENGNDSSLPTIYDPACYWGHHEAEWGMSWCASFGSTFWEGYRSILPEDDGFWDRKPLYDAYHQLNHYNLFSSSGYLNKARRQLETVKKTLDEKE